MMTGPVDNATETHLDRIVCKVLKENNAETSDVKKVTIKRYYECDIKHKEFVDINFDDDFQIRAIGKKERVEFHFLFWSYWK